MKKLILACSLLLAIHSAYAKVQIINCENDTNQLSLEIDNPSFRTLQVINGDGANERARITLNQERLSLYGINSSNNQTAVNFSAAKKKMYSISVEVPKDLLGIEFKEGFITMYQMNRENGQTKILTCKSELF